MVGPLRSEGLSLRTVRTQKARAVGHAILHIQFTSTTAAKMFLRQLGPHPWKLVKSFLWSVLFISISSLLSVAWASAKVQPGKRWRSSTNSSFIKMIRLFKWWNGTTLRATIALTVFSVAPKKLGSLRHVQDVAVEGTATAGLLWFLFGWCSHWWFTSRTWSRFKNLEIF